MTEAILVAIISLAGTLTGSYFAQRKTTALIAYRIEELEKKVHAHNNLIDRTYKLEEGQRLHEEKLNVANHRIADLEKER
jgi:type VI protein secretion system component VasK